MQPIGINCPHCGHAMQYWTMENYIYCPNCKEKVTVEPCTEKLDIDMTEEDLIEEEIKE